MKFIILFVFICKTLETTLCFQQTQINSQMHDFLKNDIDTMGLLSIHTNNIDETLVYENRVTIVHRAIKNGSIVSYVRDYYLDKSNEKIIYAIDDFDNFDNRGVLTENLLLFSKSNLNSNFEFCSIKQVKFFKIYNADLQVHNLCKLLDKVILIKKSSKFITFYYQNTTTVYSLMNYDLVIKESNLFKNIDPNFMYIRFINNYVIQFYYSDKTIEFNFITLELIQISKFQDLSGEIVKSKETYSIYIIATISVGSIISIITIVIIFTLKFLKYKGYKVPELPIIEKELKELIPTVDIPLTLEDNEESVYKSTIQKI